MSTTSERKIAILRRAFIFTSSDPAGVIEFDLFFFFSQLRKLIANLRDILVQVRNK